MNSAGKLAFQAYIDDDAVSFSEWSIWSEGRGPLSLVARQGQQAPGAPPGVTFVNFGDDPVINSAGQIAFLGVVQQTGVDRSNHRGIWAEDRAGDLHLIVRVGDQLEVAPNDFRTVRSVGFIGGSGNEDGLPSGFNDLGQLAFYALFADDSEGIFVSNLVAVPEPSTSLLAGLSMMILPLRGSRRGG
jgi:hypothetical protein